MPYSQRFRNYREFLFANIKRFNFRTQRESCILRELCASSLCYKDAAISNQVC